MKYPKSKSKSRTERASNHEAGGVREERMMDEDSSKIYYGRSSLFEEREREDSGENGHENCPNMFNFLVEPELDHEITLKTLPENPKLTEELSEVLDTGIDNGKSLSNTSEVLSSPQESQDSAPLEKNGYSSTVFSNEKDQEEPKDMSGIPISKDSTRAEKNQKGKTNPYVTKNLLPVFESSHESYLKEQVKEKDFPLEIKKLLSNKKGFNRDSYLLLYTTFPDVFKRYFINREIYRVLMRSSVTKKYKKEFLRSLPVFQKAFLTKEFPPLYQRASRVENEDR